MSEQLRFRDYWSKKLEEEFELIFDQHQRKFDFTLLSLTQTQSSRSIRTFLGHPSVESLLELSLEDLILIRENLQIQIYRKENFKKFHWFLSAIHNLIVNNVLIEFYFILLSFFYFILQPKKEKSKNFIIHTSVLTLDQLKSNSIQPVQEIQEIKSVYRKRKFIDAQEPLDPGFQVAKLHLNFSRHLLAQLLYLPGEIQQNLIKDKGGKKLMRELLDFNLIGNEESIKLLLILVNMLSDLRKELLSMQINKVGSCS